MRLASASQTSPVSPGDLWSDRHPLANLLSVRCTMCLDARLSFHVSHRTEGANGEQG